MKGFHLYTALAGTLLIGIVVAYSLFLIFSENQRANYLLELQQRSNYVPYGDIAKEESFTSVAESFRKALEIYWRRNYIAVPEEVYREGKEAFRRWMEEDYLSTPVIRNTLAAYMYSELKSYTTVRKPGFTITLVGSSRPLAQLIQMGGLRLRVYDDHIVIVIDPAQIPDEVLNSLPKVRVCEGTICRELSIFPKEKTEVTIPLRLVMAFERAREAYKLLKRKISGLGLMAGFCKGGCSACGVFKFNGEPELAYPEEDDYCKGITVKWEGMMDERGYYHLHGLNGGGCVNLDLNLYGSLLSCSRPTAILYYYLSEELNELSRGLEGNLWISPDDIGEIEAKAFVSKEVIDVAYLLSSSLIPPEVFEHLLGLKLGQGEQLLTVPGSECRVEGYGRCAYMTRKKFFFTTTDPDPKYSTMAIPMTFTFLIDLGESADIRRYLVEQKQEAHTVESFANEVMPTFNCINRIESLCTVDNILNTLLPSCPGISGSSVDEIWEKAQEIGNDRCIAAASLLVGPQGACRDPQRTCERGLTVATKDEIDRCAIERIDDCWKTLAELGKNICKDQLGTTGRLSCGIAQVFDTSNALLDKLVRKLGETLVGEAWARYPDPDELCYAELVKIKFENGELSGECYKEVNALLSEGSPCTDPVASCLLVSTIKPSGYMPLLCTYSSPAVAFSTTHTNIFDPSYMASGCIPSG